MVGPKKWLVNEVCPVCGLTYNDFRTGLTFAEVKACMHVESEDCVDWVYKRRKGVLRKWKKIKQLMWRFHIEECSCDIVAEKQPISEIKGDMEY
jgi:hypothetical protein